MPTNDLEEALEEREQIEEVERWTFALDSDGDLRINEANTLSTVDNDHAAAQGLKVALASRQGEDPLDPGFGLDILRATGTVDTLRREIRQTLEYDDFDHSRVQYVESVDVRRVPGTRHAQVLATVVLDRGEEIQINFRIGSDRRGLVAIF